ncbi:HD domain-containing protein [Candidatus Woesearchaeota archaeon]|nr:HD domain-containing protein [Candidatus Woesearchaeota archaeon]
MTIIRFFQEVNKLKSIKRTGWVRKNVKNPESVADHIFRKTLMAMMPCPNDLDSEKVIKMTLVNELPEAVTGDIRTTHLDSKDFTRTKFEKDKAALLELLLQIEDENIKKEILDIWIESEELQTREGLFFKEIDKLEMAFQALEYEKQSDNPSDFNTFWETTEHTLKTPELIELFNELKKQRD